MSFDYKRLIKFEINVGNKESKIRLIVGSILLSISLFTASILLLLAGVILIATGYTNFCPVYSAMEKNSCEETE
ncbi:MAG: DUF2892 domain-containing protein [Methylococcales bacterium]|nr:DUF2892 domain-containing protein [Methylococcales bacterium]MCK5477716.1 DUF2892 domain-containing protein [Methylococcales bacterium]